MLAIDFGPFVWFISREITQASSSLVSRLETRFSILEIFEDRESSLETPGSRYEGLSTYIWPVVYVVGIHRIKHPFVHLTKPANDFFLLSGQLSVRGHWGLTRSYSGWTQFFFLQSYVSFKGHQKNSLVSVPNYTQLTSTFHQSIFQAKLSSH